MMAANLPNFISLARLFSTPAIIWCVIHEMWQGAFYIFFLAGLSDAVDGFIAKKFSAETRLGKYLDPLADKVLLVAVFISLGLTEYLPAWLVLLVVFRDFLIVGGVMVLFAMGHSIHVSPIWSSKVNTVCQIVLATLVLFGQAFVMDFGWVLMLMIWLTGATTVFSGARYLVSWMQDLNRLEGMR